LEAVELRPLGIGEVLDVAIKIWRRNFATLVKSVVVVVAPVQVLSVLTLSSLSANTPQPGEPGGAPVDFGGDFWASVAGFLAVIALGVLAAELATAASLKAVSEAYLGTTPEWRTSLRFAVSKLRSLIWLAISTNVLLLLGLAGCIVPGVYFWGAWRVATPALLLEDLRGRKARRRSRELVRGRWWPTFVTVVLAVILNQIVAGAISSPVIALAFSNQGDSIAGIIVRAITGTASSAITTPFIAAVVIVLYFDLRVRKEGFDLELLAQGVGVAPPEHAFPHTPIPPPPPPASPDEPPFWPPPPGWRPSSG